MIRISLCGINLLTSGHLVVHSPESEATELNRGYGEQMEEEEGDGHEDIEHTVEDHLAVLGDDIATLGKTPRNGVQEPEEHEDRG